MNVKAIRIKLLMLLCLMLSASCIRKTMETELTGTSWSLVSLLGQPLIEDTQITLTFKGSYLEGRMTCNGYGGSPDTGVYTATANGKLSVEFLAVTVQLCSDPEGIMEQEDVYIKAFRSVSAYEVSQDRLMLNNPSGETVLVFRID